MEREFNAEQRKVIALSGGQHLVLAPPGCGKTAVLAERIAYAHEQGVPFRDMACLTFTNRAARGMRERILERCEANGERSEMRAQRSAGLDELFVGNVHRFCLHFLFDHGVVPEHAAVIDTDTSISIIADILGDDELQALDDNRSRQRYSQIINLQHLMRQARDGYPAPLIVHRDALPAPLLRELCEKYDLPYTQQSAVQLYMNVHHFIGIPAKLSSEAMKKREELLAARRYEIYKQTNDLLDFEDLLLETYDTLTTHEAKRPVRWLQIDEVQDLNPLQLAIIDAFCAPDATIVYLGDPQQAIFSFMGAKTDTLTQLRKRCGDHFYNFYQNYRSPQYLLDIFNCYAHNQLGIDIALLPTTQNKTERRTGDVELIDAPTNIDEANMVCRRVKQLYEQYPDETIAVVVAFNSDADEVSATLGQLPHFKISGTDFFATAPMRLLMAHLGVVRMEHDFLAWSHVLAGMKIYASNSSARQAVRSMMQLAISPADLLHYDGSTYVAEFMKTYEERDIVIFDTETTGLSITDDDVVQLAAIRIKQGKVVDRLNLFIETDRPIPSMLGDVVNPLIEEYQLHEHLSHRDALEKFVQFAHDSVILGHNATFDYQIMDQNMRRYAPHLSMQRLWPDYLDTLKLARLLHPRQKSYKLRDLLVQLGLEGTNSHLADDDIMATLSLTVHCFECARSIVGRQLEFLSRHRSTIQRFRTAYGDLYDHTCRQLFVSGATISSELQYTYRFLLEQHYIPDLPKLKYLIKYIEAEGEDGLLSEQLGRHYSDLCTMKEADLCGSASMDERVFVSTVHKAKGLEFDTVIVYNAVDGKYPSVYARGDEGAEEEARKFYVALSRARRRLIVSYCHNAVSRWGAWYSKVLTPYMKCLLNSF